MIKIEPSAVLDDVVGGGVAGRDAAMMCAQVATGFDSEDYVESRRAFAENREPVFEGR